MFEEDVINNDHAISERISHSGAVDMSTDILPDAARQSELDRMLNNHPGSEVTDTQRELIDNSILESSESLAKNGNTAQELAAVIQEANQTEDQKREAAQGDPNNVDESVSEHTHVFRRGLLTGGKYIKTCRVAGCGLTEPVEFAEWNTISDR